MRQPSPRDKASPRDNDSEEPNAEAWFDVTGWHGDRATRISLESRAELDFWKRVIAYEQAAIEARLDNVEARADRESTNFKKVQRLKTPRDFDLKVERAKAPEARAVEGLDNERMVPPIEKGGLWSKGLEQEHRSAGVMLAIGCSRREPSLAALNKAGWRIEFLTSGEGSVEPAHCGLEHRHRAAPESFAGWLSTAEPSTWKTIDVVLLGAGAGDLDLACLRHHLFPNQTVIADGLTLIGGAMKRHWDGKILSFDDGFIFKNPGPDFLDPAADEPSIDWPKISVVTVSYNQADFLEDCLRSVLDQNYPNLEYIVIDAVSTDGSIDILRRYEDRLSTLVIEPDGGQSEGLNKGFDLATGDILTWINSDDMLAPGALRRAALTFRRYGADMVTGGCERIAENSDDVLFRHHAALPFFRAVPLGLGENYMWTGAWEKGDYVFQPEVMFTADVWRRAGGYLKQHLYWAMDWELWLRMAMAGATIVNIPDTIGRSRQQDNQKTTNDELYLFQIRNILVEHSQALAALETQTTNLPLGKPRTWEPNQRMSRPVSETSHLVKRLLRLRNPRHLWQALHKRLPAGVTRRILGLKRRLLFRFGTPRFVSGATYAKWTRSNQLLASIEADTKKARDDHQSLLAERDLLLQHCDDLKAVIKTLRVKETDASWVRGAAPLADFLMTMLFDAKAEPADRQTVKTLLSQGNSVQVIARTLAIQHFSRQSAPNFELARPFLRIDLPFPRRDELQERLGSFRIVDVGAEALDFESHIYAPLIETWPAVILGFDPFDDQDQRQEVIKTENGHDVRRRTMKTFVGTGEPGTFHVNRMQATSSLMPSNRAPMSKFSLLGEALETVEKQAVDTARLDDLLIDDPDFKDGIDFLKIDVQGGSLDVLEGASACLQKTLVCHIETEFSEVYQGQRLFADVNMFMREQGFTLLDFARLGRQRYKAFDRSSTYFFQAGRLLWADSIYVRHLDSMDMLTNDDLLKLAVVSHEIYQKPDCAAEALSVYDGRTGDKLTDHFIQSQDPDKDAFEEKAASSSGKGT